MNVSFRHHRVFTRVRSSICLFAFFLGCTGVAFGSYDTWTFGGVITSGLSSGPYQAGNRYTAYFAIDTSRTNYTATGLYYPTAGYGFDVYFGSNSVVGFSASSLGSGVLIANNQATGGGSFDGIIFSQFGEQSTGFPSGAAFDGSVDGITLENNSAGPTATPFTGTSFPSTLNLNNFSNRYLTEYFQSGTVRGTVTSLTINGVLVSSVPEPGLAVWRRWAVWQLVAS